MAVTPEVIKRLVTTEDIERAERLAAANRRAFKRGGIAVPISIGTEPAPRQKPIRPVFERQVAGKIEQLVAVPSELVDPRGLDISLSTSAKKVRFELHRIIGIQSREVSFTPFVLCQETALFLPVSAKGSNRFRSSIWQPLNPWLFFDNSKSAIKELRDLGVRLR